jgi:hypothetical protein
MKTNSKRTVMSVANAIEVATGVIHQIAGDEVAKTLGGQKATRQALGDLIASRVQARFAKYTTKVAK